MARQIATASVRPGYKLVGAGILAKQDELERRRWPHFSLDFASKRRLTGSLDGFATS